MNCQSLEVNEWVRQRLQNKCDWQAGETYATNVSCGTMMQSPEDGGSMFLRNVGIYLQVHTALHPRRPTSTNNSYSTYIVNITLKRIKVLLPIVGLFVFLPNN
jgi:hypothetical protein